MTITKDIRYIGVNDHAVALFEGQYVVPGGMCYNSYAIVDEKVAIMDTVDRGFTHQWLDNIQNTLGGRKPDYLVVQHMEPDHSANIANFLKVYPEATVVSSAKAFVMMKNFFGDDYADRRIVVGEGDTLCLGKHTLTFVGAPMVHWPEVIVTYDSYDKVLFSADGFGKFGALDVEEDWADEARRYYIGIVGKYGAQVQALLKKAAGLDISIICPLHGPVLTENLGYYLNLYDIWSSYRVESDGIVVAYTSVYGHTKAAAELLAQKLADKGGGGGGVNSFTLDGDKAAISEAKSILEKKGVSYKNIWFGSDSEAGKFTSKLYSYPTTYVVDSSGNIVGQPIVGAITSGEQAKKLDALIDEAIANSGR